MKSAPLLVEEALDAAMMARDLLNTARTPPRTRGGALAMLLGAIGASTVVQPKKPPREVVRRTSNALDVFAKDFAAAAHAVGDAELIELANDAAAWGPKLWDEEVTGPELQPLMSAAEGELVRHKMLLFRNQSEDS